MKRVLFFAAAAALAGSMGCTNAKSTDVSTDAVYADLSVTARGDGTTKAVAALKVGGATSDTFLDLTGGDTLIGYNGTNGQTMTRNDFLGAIWYETTFAVDSAGAPFQISFLRVEMEGQDCNSTSAPASNVTLPGPFSITAPTGGAFSRATDPINITWDNPGSSDSMNWSISGDCIVATGGAVGGDNGTYTINAGTLTTPQGQSGNTCQVTLTVERSRSGTVDSHYGKGGSFLAKQSRSVSFNSAP